MAGAAPNTYGFDFLRQEHTQSGLGGGGGGGGGGGSESDDGPISSSSAAGLTPPVPPPEEEEPPESSHKTDLEKQFDVINFLQTHRSSGCLTPAAIYRATGIDLSDNGDDENVARMLVRNPKIRTEEMINPDYDAEEDAAGVPNKSRMITTYGYQAKFNISNKTGLLAQINRCKNGVASRDLIDAYDNVQADLDALVTGGEVVAVSNPEDRGQPTLFPRGEPFLVEIEGNVFLPDDLPSTTATAGAAAAGAAADEKEEEKKENGDKKGGGTSNTDDVIRQAEERARLETRRRARTETSHLVCTETNARTQLRRGEAVWVGGQWFRVSSAVKKGVPLSEQPPRAQAPPSVTLRKDLSKKNEVEGYVLPFTSDKLSVDVPLSGATVENLAGAHRARAALSALGISTSTISSSSALSSSSSMMRKRSKRQSLHGGGHRPGGGAASADTIKAATSNPALAYCQARRHGCTTDIKEMFLATQAEVPESEVDLYKMLVSAKLVEEGEAMRRPRMKKKVGDATGGNGKPKKRRYYERKNQRITNVHLQGTEIGAALARAAERQQQGKEVGDGGM